MSSSTAEMKKASAIKSYQMMRGHTGAVKGVVYLPDGRRIITCSYDGSLRLWDLESGTQIGNDWRNEGDEEQVWSIVLSPNGKKVASGSRDGMVRLWDIETEKVIARWTGHTDLMRSFCWSADGERVVSGSNDMTIRVWDVESGKTILGPIKTGHRFVSAVIYSPDTTKIATGGFDESASKIWDATTGKLLSTIRHDSQVWSLAWTSDQKKLISGSGPDLDQDPIDECSIRIFDTSTWQQTAILEAHKDIVMTLSLFQNDRLLASASRDKTARLWNLDTNLPVGPPLQHEKAVYDAAISAHGKLLITACGDGDVYVWDTHAILKDAGLENLLSIRNAPPEGLGQKVAVEKSLMNSDATRRPCQRRDANRLPGGFFDDARDTVHTSPPRRSSIHHRNALDSSSSLRPRILLGHLSSLFRRFQPNTSDATALQQLPRHNVSSHHRPPVVEVATAQDKQTLYVARRPERPGDKGKATQQQQGQSQGQAQASTSQTTPAVASTSTASPQVDSVTTSGATATQSQPVATSESPTWWARFVFFVCCASINQYR